MSDAATFQTETMAELCLRQGRTAEAAAILRGLLDVASDPATRARLTARLASLRPAAAGGGQAARPAALVMPDPPGVALALRDGELEIAWALAATPDAAALQVVLVLRGPDGVETVRRDVDLETHAGRLTLPAHGAQAAAVAAGVRRPDGRFVPLARAST